jgi:probable rRNA maturation factor
MEITNLTRKKIDKRLLKGASEKILEAVKIEKEAEISLVFVTENRIKEINRRYRHKNEPTDVLSFVGLNEIFVCPAVIKKQAKESKTPFAGELMRVLIHGILHLKGLDHEKSKKAGQIMRKKEEEILRKINGRAKK